MDSWVKSRLSSVVQRCTFASVCMFVLACGRAAPAPVGVSSVAQNAPLSYAFESLDERQVSSEAFRGRKVVLVFVTTWDLSSQVQTRFATSVRASDDVRMALVALDIRANKELVAEYAHAMNVSFPVALATPTDARDGIQVFGELGEIAVPTVLVLDREGRVVLRRNGLCKTEEIQAALQQ